MVLQPNSQLLVKCAGSIEDLYEVYGILCNEIHGHPWSGPSLKISSILPPDIINFIKCLSLTLRFDPVVCEVTGEVSQVGDDPNVA